jgi:hypothetical protein
MKILEHGLHGKNTDRIILYHPCSIQGPLPFPPLQGEGQGWGHWG